MVQLSGQYFCKISFYNNLVDILILYVSKTLSVAMYIEGRDNQIDIATGTKLLSIKYEFYGFSGDLIEIIN